MELESLVDFAGTAEWRRGKAAEFPKDGRNVVAADLLEQFAEEAKALEGSDAQDAVVKAFDAAYNKWDQDHMFGGPHEHVSESLRMVGFGYAPVSAAAFLADLSQSLQP